MITSPIHLFSTLVLKSNWMPAMIIYCLCHCDGALVPSYLTYSKNNLIGNKDNLRFSVKDMIVLLFNSVAKSRSLDSNLIEGLRHLNTFVGNLSCCPNHLDNSRFVQSNLVPHSDAMYQYFNYGRESIDRCVNHIDRDIEDLTRELSIDTKRTNDLQCEVVGKRDKISHIKGKLSDIRQAVRSTEVHLSNAEEILKKHVEKYVQAQEARDDAKTEMNGIKKKRIVNHFVRQKAHKVYAQHEKAVKTYRDNKCQAMHNLDVHRSDLQRKTRDLEHFQKELERITREKENMEEQFKQTSKALENKTSERKEKIAFQILLRKVCHHATVITGKVKVLRDETRGAYSFEPIETVLRDLLGNLRQLSGMRHSPIENLEIPTLPIRTQLPSPSEKLL